MSTLRDIGIEVVPVAGGVRYILPRRTGKAVRFMGWGLALFGGLVTAFMATTSPDPR